jgi:ABC-type taurine transport system substrate-binding protein
VELVASLPTSGGPDRLRVVRPGAGPAAPPPAFESGPIEGAFTSGATADLTGDGRDDALLAAEVVGDGGAPATDLWLVTLDPGARP